MDDNARPHRTLIVREYLNEVGIQRLVWRLVCPDLNEPVWDQLKRRIRGRAPTPEDLAELENALWDNQEEMSQLLIQSNLAISAKPHIETDESVDIYLLLSQQFRVVLKSVNNLNDIIVALECGLALTCKAHNLELATESHEDALKAYLEQTLIIYVDNVLENEQLEVTFYDNEGNKIDILSPDEGAYQNVEPLCQTLINR
ncbi:hypothetical protein D910_10795 [Dendroctonus ponderosae]|uniref:Uncharacterized protein n=1 Tax=Dendroctonus ponderosae TaxID=77166 RepID=U4UTJ1_DENPD|nr:hypothetical protein D910_10795 [Dendroctonus ponderosae]